MFNQEWKTIHNTQGPTKQTPPTTAETKGDFSDRLASGWILKDPITHIPIPNNNIASLMNASPDGKAMMNLYAKAISLAGIYSGTPTSNNAIYQILTPFDWREELAKVNYRINDRHTLYAKVIHDAYKSTSPYGSFINSALPLTPTDRLRPTWGPQISLTLTINSHLLNEAKLAASWHRQRTPLVTYLWKRDTYGFKFQRVFNGANGAYTEGIPSFNLGGTGGGFANVNSPSSYLFAPTTDISLIDNISYIHGDHTFRAGVLIVRNRKDQNSQANYNGAISFNPGGNSNSTGFALADAALGIFNNYQEFNGDPTGYFRYSEYTGYVQDNWRVSINLSLEIGLRYTHFVPTYSVPNNLSNFVPALWNAAQAVQLTSAGAIVPNSGNLYAGFQIAGDGVPANWISRVPGSTSTAYQTMAKGGPRGNYNAANSYAPRFSFAWTPAHTGKTVVRGGFGVFHDRTPAILVLYADKNPPFLSSVSYNYGNLSDVTGGTPAAQSVLGSSFSTKNDLNIPVMYKFNLGFQRELPWGSMLEATAVSEQGRHGVRTPNINMYTIGAEMANNALPSAQKLNLNNLRPYPGLTNISYMISDSNSNYNGLQVRATKRRGRALFTVNYTWSKALADVRSNYGDGDDAYFPMDRHFNYGETNYDRPHLFVSSYTYRLPFFAHSKGLLRSGFGGWELSGITRFQTGQYLTPVGSSSNAAQNRRAMYLGGNVALPSDQRDRNKWFNTSVFSTPPTTGTGYGNAGIGCIEGPGWQVWDLSLRKEFSATERVKIKFRADAFNAFNHVNLNNPSTTVGNINFGTINNGQPPRQIQFGLNVAF